MLPAALRDAWKPSEGASTRAGRGGTRYRSTVRDLVFTTYPFLGCGTAPRWVTGIAENPYTLPAASGGLLASAVEDRDGAGTVVRVSRSPSGGPLVVNDLRECAPGACHRLRGAAGESIGPIASSPDGRSLYAADGDGIAQLRIPR